MTSIAIDTSLLIKVLSGMVKFPSFFARYDRILLSSIVIGEYRAGLFNTRTGIENDRKLKEYMGRQSVDVVPVTERTADMYAKVYQALRREGTPIPQNDMWIAASALEHGADIATHDEHFRLVPMLSVIIP